MRWRATNSELAEFFGVTHQTIINWRGKGLPDDNDLRSCFQWYRERMLGNTKERLDEARTRLADEQQKRTELDVRRLKGELIEVERVEQVWTRLASNFKARILGMPSKLAGVLVGISEPNVIRDRIEDECNQALGELTDEGFCRRGEGGTEAAAGGIERGPAAAQADDQPVG